MNAQRGDGAVSDEAMQATTGACRYFSATGASDSTVVTLAVGA
jgi:hypothetical protein